FASPAWIRTRAPVTRVAASSPEASEPSIRTTPAVVATRGFIRTSGPLKGTARATLRSSVGRPPIRRAGSNRRVAKGIEQSRLENALRADKKRAEGAPRDWATLLSNESAQGNRCALQF